jgi:decaprenyl-phosphate phosphoribosyltransferase
VTASARDWIALARPRDWLKGLFVLLPLPFALATGAKLELVPFALGLLGFSLASSAVYALNDVIDAPLDRSHPRKALRPVASGRIPPRAAIAFAAALAVLAVALVLAADRPGAIAIVAVYFLLNAVYSLYAKAIPLVDVFLLSSYYVLRVLLGCALLAVAPSIWLLICSASLSLFLALGKRRGELAEGLDGRQRPSLEGYTVTFLDQALAVMAAVTMTSYALYTVETDVLVPGREFAALPFVLFGVLEWLRQVSVLGLGANPVDLLSKSPALVLCGLGWAIVTAWSVGLL